MHDAGDRLYSKLFSGAIPFAVPAPADHWRSLLSSLLLLFIVWSSLKMDSHYIMCAHTVCEMRSTAGGRAVTLLSDCGHFSQSASGRPRIECHTCTAAPESENFHSRCSHQTVRQNGYRFGRLDAQHTHAKPKFIARFAFLL